MIINAYGYSLLILTFLIEKVRSGAIQITSSSMDQLLENNELLFVNYYANWCRFSQMLEPIYDEFADKLAKEALDAKVAIGKVDCDVETTIAQKNQINKYPTLKLYRHGLPIKKEFRGARTVEAFINFIKDQLINPLKIAKSYSDYSVALMELKKRTIIGHFFDEKSEHFKVFSKLSSILRDSCNFVAGINDVIQSKNLKGETIVFRDIGGLEHDDSHFQGDLNNYESLYTWANEKCTPIVREITFENAEELTEEGLPFLILFHRPDETESVIRFQDQVKQQLSHLKHTINAVHADGHKFSHPLQHLGKSSSDLPVLAIDSFRHMYVFPHEFNKLSENNNLLIFVQDLHSGKLHREFHNGPDPTTTQPPKPIANSETEHIPKLSEKHDDSQQHQKRSTPPESVFIKLAPSRERYSLKLDGEL
jgi:endoplasmic reticulum resident protein 44